jgi:hypothetical protein
MSAATQARYREAHVNAFRKVLAAWLASLPADGWEGGVEELGASLWAITRGDPVPTRIPTGTGLGRVIAAEQPFIMMNGFTIESRRTKHARTLRFSRR